MKPRTLDALSTGLLLLWTGMALEFALVSAPALFQALPARDLAGSAALSLTDTNVVLEGKLPKGVDQATADAAKVGLEQVKSDWTSALADFNMGKVTDAVTKANAIKAKADELLSTLGVKSA